MVFSHEYFWRALAIPSPWLARSSWGGKNLLSAVLPLLKKKKITAFLLD